MTTEFFSLATEETSITIAASEVTAVRRRASRKMAARIYADGKLAIAGARGEVSRESLAEAASRNLSTAIPYPPEPSRGLVRAHASQPCFADSAEFLTETELCLAMLRREFPDLVFSYKGNYATQTTKLENDAGTRLEHTDSTASLDLIIQERASANVMDFFACLATHDWKRETLHRELREWCQAFSRRHAPLRKEGRMPVVFMGGELTLKYLAQHLDARAFLAGSSAFRDELGKRIFSPHFSLGVARNPTRHNAEPFFDQEGTLLPGDSISLIERGVLRRPYADKRSALQGGFSPTASAKAAYDAVPQPTASHLCANPTHESLKALTRGEPALLVISAAGGDFASDGAFATPVQMGFWWDGEKVAGRAPECNVRSHVRTMFGDDYLGATEEVPILKSETGKCPPLVAATMNVSF